MTRWLAWLSLVLSRKQAPEAKRLRKDLARIAARVG
jgi:hypothetical protein